MVVLLTSAMSLIRDDYHYLWPGLALLACAAACSELATVPYNAMLRQLSTPETSGRISGFGWGMGYFGSVVLLLIVYARFISGDGDTRGLLGLPVADGQNVRAAMLMAAAWFVLFALPVFIVVPHPKPDPEDRRKAVGFFGAYRKLWAEVVGEWRRDRNIVYYLLASAVFRDGLAGVFAFGAVLGVSAYGISNADVLLFGVSASVIAAVGALLGGLVDDRLGSKPVIVGSLASMIAVGTDPDDAVRTGRLLGLRAAAVSVHRADAVLGADADAAHVGRRQGGCRVRPLHHHRTRGVLPCAVAHFAVHRLVRHRSGRHRWLVGGARHRPGGHGGGARTAPDTGALAQPRCRSSGRCRCSTAPGHR